MIPALIPLFPLAPLLAGAFPATPVRDADTMKPGNVGDGMVKTVVFGVAATFVALYMGYESNATPEGVAQATTRTVVFSSVAVLILDFLLTSLMFHTS